MRNGTPADGVRTVHAALDSDLQRPLSSKHVRIRPHSSDTRSSERVLFHFTLRSRQLNFLLIHAAR